MTTALRRRRRALALTLALVAGAGTLAVSNPAEAQVPDPGTGAQAGKNCPADVAAPGQTITCGFAVANTGDFDAVVTALTEIPFPGGPIVDISCTIAGGAVISEGGILAPNTLCAGTFQVTVPNDPALCNTGLVDRVDIELLYPTGFPTPLTAGAFATETTSIECPAITLTKTADELSKVGDPVTYTFVICNGGDITVNRGSVTDTVLGDLTAFFPATLTPGQCVTVVRTRTVAPGDLDPLVNTVTATYSAAAQTATATATDSTNLFQPSVDVTKSCGPDPIVVGQAELCTIVVTNTSSADSPALQNGTISDTLTGDLLAAGNAAVVSSTCTATLAVGASCTINTTRTVISTDPSPLINTVTVHYNPVGFPNDITDSASDQVIIETPPGGEGCTPGFWKQDQHFDSWAIYSPTDSFELIFGVDITLGSGKPNDPFITNPTLLQALNAGGGGDDALARHAVAALLNAASPDVDFDFTTAEVIDLVQDAFASGDFETAKNLLAAANEAGCPLN